MEELFATLAFGWLEFMEFLTTWCLWYYFVVYVLHCTYRDGTAEASFCKEWPRVRWIPPREREWWQNIHDMGTGFWGLVNGTTMNDTGTVCAAQIKPIGMMQREQFLLLSLLLLLLLLLLTDTVAAQCTERVSQIILN
ncbi:hypothetical protein M426DRAFT_128590 [Hypoxylon sp. CI-4A]|nr:hypothetical protein M426DRAFT_128590 [Hypoxylon sp. CI-4A]